MKPKYTIDLNRIIKKLKESKTNYVEFYEKKGKIRKSFRDVYIDVMAAAAELGKKNLKKGDRVAIIARTDYQYMVIDLACLAKGLFTVPLDINKPYDIKEIINEFKVSMIITNLEQYLENEAQVCSFNEICTPENNQIEITPAVYEENDIFTTTFTSGTSGKQKAIEIRVKSFNDQFSNACQMFELNEKDKILIFLPMNIYLERCYIYLAILKDFNVVVAPTDYVLKAIKKGEMTFTVGVPYFFESMYELFMMGIRSNITQYIRFRIYKFFKDLGLDFLVRKQFTPFKTFWGGKARFMLTGSAACKKKILNFYHKMGIPLYEGYGMSEIASMIALNYPENTRLGSVGKVFPNKEIKFDDEGQIYVRGDYNANIGYYNVSKAINDSTFLPGGWVATGDIGHLDKDGYMYIDGRSKDVIALSNGKKIHPTYIEEKINHFDDIGNCVIMGDDRPFLVAIIAPKDPSTDKSVIDKILQQVNHTQPADEQIENYFLQYEPFTPQNGMLTPAFKLNRKYIKKKFEKEIDNLY